jgi:sarcosine oxidase gamma subunit
MPSFNHEISTEIDFLSPSMSVRSWAGLTQHMVSGDLDAFNARHAMGKPIGLLGLATGQRYAVRMARDRIIAVRSGEKEMATGWNPEGYAVTCMSSALHVFELSGPAVMKIVARGCTFDPRKLGLSSAISFAGVTVSLYRYDDPNTIRLHVDRSLAEYLLAWILANSNLVGLAD